MTKQTAESGSQIVVPLKDPMLATFLAWLIPGLGHLYQGRTAKAVLYFVCIMGTFVYGLYLGGNSDLGWGRVVYASWRPLDRRLPCLCQLGVGLPAMPALVQANIAKQDKEPLLGGFMAPPALGVGDFNRNRQAMHNGGFDRFGQPSLHTLHKKLHAYFELGTVYTMIAGLLNLLAIFDAWGGPVFMEEDDKPEEDEEEKKEEPEPQAASNES